MQAPQTPQPPAPAALVVKQLRKCQFTYSIIPHSAPLFHSSLDSMSDEHPMYALCTKDHVVSILARKVRSYPRSQCLLLPDDNRVISLLVYDLLCQLSA